LEDNYYKHTTLMVKMTSNGNGGMSYEHPVGWLDANDLCEQFTVETPDDKRVLFELVKKIPLG